MNIYYGYFYIIKFMNVNLRDMISHRTMNLYYSQACYNLETLDLKTKNLYNSVNNSHYFGRFCYFIIS